jgi:hypothetical protein
MQADASLASAILRGDGNAREELDLDPADLELLLGADPRALRADPEGRRRMQLLGNITSEYSLTQARMVEREGGRALIEGFFTSPEFHQAMRTDARLPLAFGEWAEGRAHQLEDDLLHAFACLEHAMVRARRAETPHEPRAEPVPPGCLVRSPHAHLLDLPRGTHAAAKAARRRLEPGSAGPAPRVATPDPRARETLLILAAARSSPHRLAELEVEVLLSPADQLLRALERPLDREARARLAGELGTEPAELESFAAALAGERILLRGEPAASASGDA